MPVIQGFELYQVDLPFRKPFKHAAANRNSSHSIMLKCLTDCGHAGFGESLPREYVTGETRQGCFSLLKEQLLPRLVGRSFQSLAEVRLFLEGCDGKAPSAWLAPDVPQTAAWAAVDLGLLDAFGHAFNQPVRLDGELVPAHFRYSGVCSADRGWSVARTLLLYRLFGFKAIKLKVEENTEDAVRTARLCRLILGKQCDIRVDANMVWNVETALTAMRSLSVHGIRSFEQPLPADDLEGMARLIRETGLEVMADESLHDSVSLERLIKTGSCSSVNVRISKCGGVVAAYNRCKRALAAGLDIQIGCQVGETSLLSAAQLLLIAAVGQVRFGEGCFGLHLLREDPVHPLMQFGRGGTPPNLPVGPGFGVRVDEQALARYCSARAEIS